MGPFFTLSGQGGRSTRVSIVVPVLNEAAGIGDQLRQLQPMRHDGLELIVVDGGSDDDSASIAISLADKVLSSPRGRAKQMNAGAACSNSDTLLFLHADTKLPDGAIGAIASAIEAGSNWGRFDVQIDSEKRTLALVSWAMNVRSRLTGIATGDQAIFVRRSIFEQMGGYPEIVLMEDVAISASLKRYGRPACIRLRVLTSARKWHRDGVLRTILLMWGLRLAFRAGVNPERLARWYGY